ncbi:MAG: PIN domain nuclease, partial [Anaerolinea sp.]|nr:PIN domain nuclease [Anaerolinea sp.]
MTVLVDTHAWLWWLTDGPELSPVARNELDEAGSVLVPAICLWEVAMLTQKGRFE